MDYAGRISQEQINLAKATNLYNFLLQKHPDDVEAIGYSLRLKSNHSVSLGVGYSGFFDFEENAGGDSITFLTDFLGYSFPDAVRALCEFARTDTDPTSRSNHKRLMMGPGNEIKVSYDMDISPAPSGGSVPMSDAQHPAVPTAPKVFTLPPVAQPPYTRVIAYLTQVRAIPEWIVTMLIDCGLLYQDARHSNAVFINAARTFAEIRGTLVDRPFHQVADAEKSAYWAFTAPGSDTRVPPVAFISEAAIDAISLYALMYYTNQLPQHGIYCTIAGVANQQRIDRIKAEMAQAGGSTVIAVDSDDAGAKCRARNSDCRVLIPASKDWNEDLKRYVAGTATGAAT